MMSLARQITVELIVGQQVKLEATKKSCQSLFPGTVSPLMFGLVNMPQVNLLI